MRDNEARQVIECKCGHRVEQHMFIKAGDDPAMYVECRFCSDSQCFIDSATYDEVLES